MGFSYNVSVLNQKGSPAIYTDTFANRPAFGYAGRLFIANDTSAIYEDTGTAWVLIANVSSGAGTLQQVTTNGNTSNVGISITAGGLSSNSVTNTSLTNGSVLFSGPGGLVSQDNPAFFWDDTNNRLGINTNTPGNSLDVHTSGTNPILALNNTVGSQSAISFLNTAVAKWRIGNTSTNTFDFYNFSLAQLALTINGSNNFVQFLKSIMIAQGAGFSPQAGYNGIGGDAGGFFFNLGTNAFSAYLNFIGLTGGRTFTFPDASGTLALTSNLASYLPLSGGTLTGNLNGTTANLGNTNGTVGTLNVTGRIALTTSLFFSSNLTAEDRWEINGINVNQLAFNKSGTGDLMRLTGLGNLLINSTIDDTVNKLQVTGSIKVTSNINSNVNDGSAGLNIQPTTNTNSAYAQFLNNDGYAYIGKNSSTGGNLATGTASYAFVMATYKGSGTTAPIQFAPNNTIALTIAYNGIITVNNLAGTGSRAVLADASGNLSAPVSDISVKQNIVPLKYGLETILKLNAVQFEFIEGYKNYGEGLQIGNIAQDVEKIIPEAVFTTPLTGLKGINYDQFNGIYIKAIQEQQSIIDGLLKRIQLLENK